MQRKQQITKQNTVKNDRTLVFVEFVQHDIAVIIGNWQAKQIEEGLAWLVKFLLMHNEG